MARILPTLVFSILIISVAPTKAYAYTFTPSDLEWQTWPNYCKAKYVWTNAGKKSKFANQVTARQRLELKQWETEGIRGLHHFCTGTIWLNRARREANPDQKKYMLRNAVGETMFTYERSNVNSPKFAFIVVQIALIYFEQGEHDAALQVLQAALEKLPRNDVLYSATAILQRKLGKTQDARDTLLLGFKAMDGKSPEICYNLGLLSLELGQIDDAEKYAKLAYEQNYPLPGLRVKLEKLGRM